MKLYNTLTRTIEEIVPVQAPNIGFYACGPTVYDYVHIGHLRKYGNDDLLVRVLRYAGFTVNHVQNITDVGHLVSDDDAGEDKMEKGARKYGKSVWDLAQEFEAYFWKSLDAMAIARPTVSCKATDHIDDQIKLIQTLESKGFTYTINDGVYFDTSKFPDYGKLARLDLDASHNIARVEMVEGKKHSTDFALWKFSPKDEKRQMEWESPWGVGFPGWHIECSAMSMKYLGEQFDIHTGGIDHIPIHHSNEIAQSEAATGKHPFVRYWVHYNFLRVDGQKMSKSLQNFYTIDDITNKGYDPMALKLFFYSAHYRSELNFTWDSLEANKRAYAKLVQSLAGFKQESDRDTLSKEKLEKVGEYRTRFFDFLTDDLHTAEAIAVLWEVMKSNIPSRDKYELVREFDVVLGLELDTHIDSYVQTHADIPTGVQMLLDQRQEARNRKDFAKADDLRRDIAQFGWSVEDTSSGQKAKKGM